MKTTGLLALLCVVGCTTSPSIDGGLEAVTASPESDAGTPDAGEPMSLEVYETKLASAFCAKIFGCCLESEIQMNFGDVMDEPSCRTKWLARFAQRRGLFETSIAAGRMRFLSEQGTQCLADISTLACADFNRWFGPQSCAAAYQGRVAVGETCVLTEDCSGLNGACLETSPGQHQCVAPIGAGERCGEEFGRCSPGTRCVGSSNMGPPVCVNELPLGSPCVVGSQCASQTCGPNDTCEPTPKYCGG